MTDQTGNSPRYSYRDLFERSADANLIIDGDTFVDCNEATVRMLRYESKEALLQTHPSELSPEFQPDGRPSFEKANEMMATALAEGSHRFEWMHKRADGEVFPVEVLLTRLPGSRGTLLHTVWREITKRKRLEAELLQAQKMDAIGRLTGAIAHDFNNLLVAIIGHTELMEMSLEETSELADHVRQIRRAGDRAASLVSQLLAFSRKQVQEPTVLDLNQALAGLDTMLGRLLGEDIQVVTELSTVPLPLLADPGQVEQVVVNLATNARDAMSDGGRLRLKTEAVTLGGNGHPVGPDLDPGDYALISVADTGTGINDQALANIFEPFFTTKPRGKGTGLGLSTVYGIVKQNGGDIVVETAEGVGTTFRVYWPLTTEQLAEAGGAADPLQPARRGNEAILVVEDDPAVASLMETVLQGNGYTTYRAVDGQDALEVIDKLDLQFDLLLTDVVMPRMGGPELASRLREERPGLRVLFASGYASSALSHFGNLETGVNLIQKPFRARELLDRVRWMLDQ